MTEDEFRKRLAEKGIVLEGKALAAALAGARHLRDEVARLRALMANRDE